MKTLLLTLLLVPMIGFISCGDDSSFKTKKSRRISVPQIVLEDSEMELEACQEELQELKSNLEDCQGELEEINYTLNNIRNYASDIEYRFQYLNNEISDFEYEFGKIMFMM